MALAIAAAAIVIGAVIGLRQVAASQAGHVQAGSNTEVIRAILADAHDREEASDTRAWEFVGQSLDQLQAAIIECEKGRADEQRRNATYAAEVATYAAEVLRLKKRDEERAIHTSAMQEVMDRMEKKIAADRTVETPR